MKYRIEFKPRALKDLKGLDKELARRILDRIEEMGDGLIGHVKRLTAITPEYRLRVGDHRVLFEVDGDLILVYRVVHRREAYR